MGHGLIRLDGQFDCSLFELGTIRWGFVFAHGRGLTSLADTRLPNCPLQCSHFNFNDEVDMDWSESEVRAVHLLLYNDAAFTLGRVAVWVEKDYQGGTREIQLFNHDGDVVEEEVRDFMGLLRPSVRKIRVGFKAKGEISEWPFNGYNWKKCDWIDLNDVNGGVFRADGALYDKECHNEYEETLAW